MFRPFQRLGDRSNGTGVGLGLAVARGSWSAMGAEITLDDTPGGGTTMVRRRAAESRRDPPGARGRRRGALRRALSTNLTARGYEVDAVTDRRGRAGLPRRASTPTSFVLDLGLPGMDGVEVIRGLRGWSRVPIIVLSARDAEASKVAALDAGADDYVTKPFGMDELLARLRSALRRAAPARGSQSS